MFLCFRVNECAKAIIQAGIKTVIYDCDKYEHTPSVIASKRMLDAAGVRYYKYNRTGRKINLGCLILNKGEEKRERETGENLKM